MSITGVGLIRFGITTFLWLLLAQQAWRLWHAPENRPWRAATVGLLSAALMFTVGQGPVESLLADAFPGLPRVLLNLLITTGLFSLLGFFVCSVHSDLEARRRMRRHLCVLSVLMTAAVVSWCLAPARVRMQPATPGTAQHSLLSVFLGTNLIAMSYALVLCLRYAIRSALSAGRKRLRRGLIVLSVGLGALTVECGLALTLAVLTWVVSPSAPVWEWLRIGYVYGLIIGMICVPLGLLYPVVAAIPETLPRWLRDRRDFHDLEHLWRALDTAFPKSTPARSPRRRTVHGRRYRRVIDIREGLVRLGPYCAHVSHDGATDPQGQAEQVLLALEAKMAGAEPGVPSDPMPISAECEALDQDVRWLVRVSRSMSTVYT